MQPPLTHQPAAVWFLLPSAGKKQEIRMESDFFFPLLYVFSLCPFFLLQTARALKAYQPHHGVFCLCNDSLFCFED